MIAKSDLNNFGGDLPDERDQIGLRCDYRRRLNYRRLCCSSQVALLRGVGLPKLASLLVLLLELLQLLFVLLLQPLQLPAHQELDRSLHLVRLLAQDRDAQLGRQLRRRQVSPRLFRKDGPLLRWNGCLRRCSGLGTLAYVSARLGLAGC